MAARRLSFVALALAGFTAGAVNVAQESPLSGIESMIAMRDGVRLYTQIYTPKQRPSTTLRAVPSEVEGRPSTMLRAVPSEVEGRTEPLPTILLRTPYGTGTLNPTRVATALAHLLA